MLNNQHLIFKINFSINVLFVRRRM